MVINHALQDARVSVIGDEWSEIRIKFPQLKTKRRLLTQLNSLPLTQESLNDTPIIPVSMAVVIANP